MADPTLQDLIDRINDYFAQPVLLASFNNRSDLYEVFLWTIVLKAAAAEGATVTFHTPAGVATSPFKFRKGPGPIARIGTTAYVHARLEFTDRPGPLEVHQGIYVSGTSLNRHECDVAVLDATECDAARQHGHDPRSSKALLAIEAKLYGARIGIDLARGFSGLEKDLYLRKDSAFFVTNSTMRLVTGYLNRHSYAWQDNVSCDEPRTDDFQTLVRRRFQVWVTR